MSAPYKYIIIIIYIINIIIIVIIIISRNIARLAEQNPTKAVLLDDCVNLQIGTLTKQMWTLSFHIYNYNQTQKRCGITMTQFLNSHLSCKLKGLSGQTS